MDSELRDLLVSLKNSDIELRTKILESGSLYEGYDEEMESLHNKNAEMLDEVITNHGWPGKSLVGEDGADAAVMIAQHSISKPNLQRKFLEHIKIAVEGNEVLPIHEACLEDRILYNEGKPQIYGMLFEWNENGEFVTDVEDIKLANQRRKRLGIRTIEEAKQLHLNEIMAEGGAPPSDCREHLRKKNEWAKRVGWR